MEREKDHADKLALVQVENGDFDSIQHALMCMPNPPPPLIGLSQF
jgi:hypothetical protein